MKLDLSIYYWINLVRQGWIKWRITQRFSKKNSNNRSSHSTLWANIWSRDDYCNRLWLLCHQGTFKLKEYGRHIVASIKKRRYWPWDVDGDIFTSRLMLSPVGTCDLIMELYNSVEFRLILRNEPNYVSKYMSTFVPLTVSNKYSKEFYLLQDG